MGVGKNNEGMVSPGFSPNVPMRISQIPRSILPPNRPNHSLILNSKQKLQHGFQRFGLSVAKPTRSLCTKAVLSEIPNQELYGKVGANSTGPIPIGQLVGAVEKAAKTGAEVFSLALCFCDSLNVPAFRKFCNLKKNPDGICICFFWGMLEFYCFSLHNSCFNTFDNYFFHN
ncbi:hypothetical protein ACFX1Z_023025 [Malus domestica]